MKYYKHLILSTLFFGILVADIPESWNINPANYENYMTVTAVLEVNNVLSNSNSIALGAFVDDECRGYSYPILVGEKWMYFLMVYANSNDEVIEFSIYDINNELTSPAYDFIAFESGIPFGTPDEPHLFHSTLNTTLLGDLTSDFTINILDVVFLVDAIIYWDGSPPTSEDIPAGDLTQDGNVNIQDIVALVNLILTDTLNRQIIWYYDEDQWVFDETRGSKVSSANIFYNHNMIGIHSDGDVAGIQLTISGDYTISNDYLPNGWDLKHHSGTVLIYSVDGSKLSTSKLFEYMGDLTIENSIVADWYGSDISVSRSAVPDKYLLSNAYPNPFNPVTKFSFSLPEDGYVSIGVYNLKGQLINNIVNAKLYAGSHMLRWDAGDVGSGVYLLRMQAGSYSSSQKLMLIK